MSKTKNHNLPQDYQYALILGFVIGVFLLPVENHLPMPALGELKLATLLFFPLISFAGTYFVKLIFGRFRNIWQFYKFFLIGIGNTAINIGLLNYLILITGRSTGFYLSVIAATAYIASVVHSYIWNTHWSFRKERDHSKRQFHRFMTVTVSSLFINAIVILVVDHLLRGSVKSLTLQANIADAIALIATMFWNFFGYKCWVFKKK